VIDWGPATCSTYRPNGADHRLQPRGRGLDASVVATVHHHSRPGFEQPVGESAADAAVHLLAPEQWAPDCLPCR
jgi:hypothetical protein